MNDLGYDREILSFEDMRRDQGSDNDFNDVVFSITSNPPSAMAEHEATLPQPQQPKDADGDGVLDQFDAYPNDPLRAFDSFCPAKGTFGTLAFEDLWPGIGDYDFNDMIVDYNIQQVSNAQNNIVEVNAQFVLRAVGASFRSGFGFQLPIPPSQITSVTGAHLTEGIVKIAGNGCEAGQSKATIIVFEDAQRMMQRPGGYYINSQLNAPYVKPDTINVKVTFSPLVPSSTLGAAPYNPFIFVNHDRGKEIHLVDQPPTDLANKLYFDVFADNSNAGQGRYYRTKLNHPWAMNFPEMFDYPIEYTKISDAYLNFISWAESGGQVNKNWYTTTSGNRNSALIFRHP
jgi:LruC domain-containing protein